MELTGRIVLIQGSVVGYQFAKRSMGYRTFKNVCVKVVEGQQVGSAYIPFLEREIKVERIAGSDTHWVAV